VNWPPLLVDGNPTAGEGVNGNLLGVLARTDGTRQVMYNGMPLYYFKNDANAGDTLGQNVGKVWFIVKPNTTTVGGQGVTLRGAQDAKLGPILVDGAGMTLYLYTKDSPNTTVCYDGCATAWPPLLVGAGVTPALDGIGGNLGTVLRNDGNLQVTYNGIPLYYWFRDKKPGDTLGQGVNNVWYVIPPTAAAAPAANAPAAPAAAPAAPAAAPAAPAAPAALPTTGGADLPVAPAAVALLLAGVGLAIRPRRR
jgi:predicted lipoprotein with Yx(FWY)xxD motif